MSLTCIYNVQLVILTPKLKECANSLRCHSSKNEKVPTRKDIIKQIVLIAEKNTSAYGDISSVTFTLEYIA